MMQMKEGHNWWTTIWKGARPGLLVMVGAIVPKLMEARTFSGMCRILGKPANWDEWVGAAVLAVIAGLGWAAKNVMQQRAK